MSLFANLLGTVFDRSYQSAGKMDDRPIEALAEALLQEPEGRESVEGACRVIDRFARLDDEAKHAFFTYLGTEMDIDIDALGAAVAQYRAASSPNAYRALMATAEPRRQTLARRLNRAPGATARLVEMRADLRRLNAGDEALGRVDLDLRHLLGSWFNRGFLVLAPITWATPANVLEKIIAYEAVHAIESWDDLRRRLQPADRRCFAFFHPAMPDEPLIFVEVALTKGVPGSIQTLLAPYRQETPVEETDTAVFYSISNCQPGLAGVSFGNSLIKQVVADLQRDTPHLSRFITLSPIPGLAKWMAAEGETATDETTLRQSAARYLLKTKTQSGLPRDPVARFHLGNGATVYEIHANADRSERGLTQSHGAMVNYLYNPDRISPNQDAFTAGEEVAATTAVKALAKDSAKR